MFIVFFFIKAIPPIDFFVDMIVLVSF